MAAVLGASWGAVNDIARVAGLSDIAAESAAAERRITDGVVRWCSDTRAHYPPPHSVVEIQRS